MMNVKALRNAVTLESTRNNVLTARFTGIKAGWQQYILLTSDVHFDSPYCDREMYKRHLERAVNMDALIFDNGDWFDAMQGRDDKRRNTGERRKELDETAYTDTLVREGATFLGEFAPWIAFLGEGNHELSVKQKVETNLTGRLAERLREQHKGITNAGAYSGWIWLTFEAQKGTAVQWSTRIYHHHGAGGGGPMTHGVLDTRRQASYLPDADVIWNAHCFDDKTEILTPDGWVTHDKLVLGSQVMTFNRETGKMEYQACTAVHRYADYKELTHIKTRHGVDLAVTDKHGLWVGPLTMRGGKSNVPNWQEMTAEQAYGKRAYFRIAAPFEGAGLPLSTAQVRVLAWIACEANLSSNYRFDGDIGLIRLAQSDAPDGRLQRLEADLTAAGLRFTKKLRYDAGTTEHGQHRNFDAYILNVLDANIKWREWISKYLGPKKELKSSLREMSSAQVEEFIQTWVWADGSVTPSRRGFQLASNSKQHIDFLQELVLFTGRRCSISLNKGMYYMSCCDKNAVIVGKDGWSKAPYEGTVWCVTVPNHTLVVRRNGKPCITMNTHTSYLLSSSRLRLNKSGYEALDRVDFVRTAGYKDEWTGMSADGYGYAFQRTKMNPPSMKGSVLMRLWYEGGEIRREFTEWKY